MKAILLALSMSALSFAAGAGEVTFFEDEPMSTKSRAEVRAEVAAALSQGERLSYGEVDPRHLAVEAGTRTRAEVRAELFEARAAGELPPVGEA